MTLVPSPARRVAGSALLALLTAASWWAWMAWDRGYQVDAVTGVKSGPYEAWQVVGCGVCLIVLAAVASGQLPAWLVLVTMPVAFTVAWTWTAAPTDRTGLWVVGAMSIFLGMVAGTAVVVLCAAEARRVHRDTRPVGRRRPDDL